MTATNITELIWNNDICGTLRLCGIDAREIDASVSDYEKFRALCRAMPMLRGHRLPMQIGQLLRDRFDLSLMPSPETCDRLWLLCADKLAEHSFCKPLVLPPIRSESMKWNSPMWYPLYTVSVFDASLFLHTKAESWYAWETEMQERLDDFLQDGRYAVLFKPTADMCEKFPDIYHVDQALKKRDDPPLLMAQLFRFLSVELSKRNATLLLDADRCGKGILSFLTRIEQRVGLPQMVWMSEELPTRDALIAWQACARSAEIRYAVRASVTDDALREIAARYPLGRLWMLAENGTGKTRILECKSF